MSAELGVDLIASVQNDVSIDWEHLNELDVLAAWRKHTGIVEETLGAMFVSAFETAIGAEHSQDLHFDTKGWRVKASGQVVKSAFILATLAIALRSVNASDLPPALLTAVLPLLLDIERVKLKRSEQDIYFTLALSADGKTGTPEELYGRLAPRQKEDISLLEFQDLLDQFRQAGLADLPNQRSLLQPEQYEILSPGQMRFRISFE